MPIDPDTIIKFRASGDGDMATVTNDGPNPSFGLDGKYVLVAIRAWTTAGTGNATLTIYQKIAAERSGVFDKTIRTFSNFGATNRFFDFRIDEADQHHWVFDDGDLIVPDWTNPDAGTMTWAIEVHLRRVRPGELAQAA